MNLNRKKINKIYVLGKKVFSIFRSITGEGNRSTLKVFKKNFKNLKIKEIKSGTKVFDWKIPEEWNINDAFVLDKNNKKIIDFKVVTKRGLLGSFKVVKACLETLMKNHIPIATIKGEISESHFRKVN